MRNLLTCILMFTLLALSAQDTVSLDVTVVDEAAQGVPDASIAVWGIDMNGAIFFEEEGKTGSDGILAVDLALPSGVTEGSIFAEELDCFGGNWDVVDFEKSIRDYAIELEACWSNPDTNWWMDTCIAHIECDYNGDLIAVGFGEPEFTYLWSTGDTTATISPSDTGEYCVTITDANDCVAEACSYVHPPDTSGWDSCFAVIFPEFDANGDLILTAFGPNVDVTYSWSTGDTTASILADSTMREVCVTISDMDSCEAEFCIDVEELFHGGGGGGYQDTCIGYIANDYNGNLIAVGLGEPDFTYLWSTGDTTSMITPIDTGEYCVTITDANGCVAEACGFAYPPDTTGWDSCFALIFPEFDANGDLILTAFGPDAQLTYSWSTGDTTVSILADSTMEEVCVTISDMDSCEAEFCIDVRELFDGGGYQDTCLAYIECDYNGDLIAGSFGKPDFTYLWSTGDTTASISPSDTGEYCVTITDANGCVAEACSYVHPPDTTSHNSIAGFVTLDTLSTYSLDDVEIELYQLDANGQYALLSKTNGESEQGFPFFAFQFDDVDNGTYIIKAIPTSKSNKILETYHRSASVWDDANEIIVNDNDHFIDIMLLEKVGLDKGGKSTIVGQLISSSGLTQNGTEGESPVSDARIILKDMQGLVLETTLTDQEGEFEFNNVRAGQYMLTFDHINTASQEVMVELGDGQITNITIDVKGTISSVKNDFDNAIRIWPNPVIDELTISLGKTYEGGQLRIISPAGQVIREIKINSLRQSVDLAHLPNGIYILEVALKGKRQLEKIIKI